MQALLAELSIDVLSVVLVVKDFLLHLVKLWLNKRVAARPDTHAISLLVYYLALIVKPSKLFRVPVGTLE